MRHRKVFRILLYLFMLALGIAWGMADWGPQLMRDVLILLGAVLLMVEAAE